MSRWMWMVAGLLACNGDKDGTETGTPTAPVATWAAAFDASGAGALSGVWGSGPDDVWIVGGDDTAAEIWHFDGGAWSEVAAPAVGLLVWVYGFGPDDVYAVGVEGAAVHWDGDAWNVLDSGTTQDLWGVWGSATDDLWAVGGSATDGDPVILHWDGAAFTPVALDPAENDRLAHELFKVWGIGGRTFAVGQYGLIVEWDGSQWVQLPSGAEATDDFVSLWGTSADHVVAVGGRSNGQVATFDGTSWTTTHPSGVPGLNAVSMGSADEAVIGGIGGWVGSFDPNTGTITREDPVDSIDVHAIWYDGAGTWYGVGGKFYAPYAGTALVRTVE